MPCYNGIAVSVHADGAPLPEYSIQKQSRVARVNAFIPVPAARVPSDSTTNIPEPAKFAISITLLTEGLEVPYSKPKPTSSNPHPQGHTVGFNQAVKPYIPVTGNENETIAAYIYFDGRAKEEVATLLRPGEETWVNSRWVQVPDSEGGGLAEREFLFREVGLERWLNGLDLEGSDTAAKIERRRKKFERRMKRETSPANLKTKRDKWRQGDDVVRYGADDRTPVEEVFHDPSSSDSSDDDAPPQANGQIKVAMFRVLASGEIKKGEYSPQFDAHDDDEGSEFGANGASNDTNEKDVDHTTSFAKPKTLDPKSISTQTVTGIDGPEKPYATFTFFYRGERQLQKMGVMESKEKKASTLAAKRRSSGLDFGDAGTRELSTKGTLGFSSFRDPGSNLSRNTKSKRKSNGGLHNTSVAEDSEEDDDDLNIVGKMDEDDEKDIKSLLSPDDAMFPGEIAKGVERIQLKRAHSVDPSENQSRKSSSGTPAGGSPPPLDSTTYNSSTPGMNISNGMLGKSVPDDSIVGSPMKRHRGSIYGDDGDMNGMKKMMNSAGFQAPIGDVLRIAEEAQVSQIPPPAVKVEVKLEDEIEM